MIAMMKDVPLGGDAAGVDLVHRQYNQQAAAFRSFQGRMGAAVK